jgi:hypothetical protein
VCGVRRTGHRIDRDRDQVVVWGRLIASLPSGHACRRSACCGPRLIRGDGSAERSALTSRSCIGARRNGGWSSREGSSTTRWPKLPVCGAARCAVGQWSSRVIRERGAGLSRRIAKSAPSRVDGGAADAEFGRCRQRTAMLLRIRGYAPRAGATRPRITVHETAHHRCMDSRSSPSCTVNRLRPHNPLGERVRRPSLPAGMYSRRAATVAAESRIFTRRRT